MINILTPYGTLYLALPKDIKYPMSSVHLFRRFHQNEMWDNRIGRKKKSGLGVNPKMHLYTLSLSLLHYEAGFV